VPLKPNTASSANAPQHQQVAEQPGQNSGGSGSSPSPRSCQLPAASCQQERAGAGQVIGLVIGFALALLAARTHSDSAGDSRCTTRERKFI
jgi:hypothetical protein